MVEVAGTTFARLAIPDWVVTLLIVLFLLKQLVADMGLLEYWRASGNWADYCRSLPATENHFECF